MSRDSSRSIDPALLRKLVDNIPGMVAYWDKSLRCRFANRAYERWAGVPPEQMVGLHISDFLGPLYPLNLPHMQAVLRGEPQEFERELPDPDGGTRSILIHYVPDVVDGDVIGFIVLVADVSALKQTEQALRESEERFRLTIDEAPIGMALVGADGRALRVNRALCEILGYSLEELTGMSFRDLTYPPDLNADLELLERLISGKLHRYQLEKRYVRKDGRLVNALLSGSVVRAPDGRPRYFITQVQDLTERKRLADELRVAEKKASGILAISADAIISIDDQQRVTMFNRSAEQVFGYTAEEVLGEPIDMLIPERFRRLHRHHVARFAQGPEVARHMSEQRTEVIGLRKNGEEFPADATISKLELEGGKLLTVALRDISERKQAQALLQQTQERLELALEGADLASWDWNVETGKLVFNRRWAHMLGYDAGELEPHVDTWRAAIHPEDLPRVMQALNDCCLGLSPLYESEHRLVTKSGTFIWVLDRGKIFARGSDGRALRMVGTQLDITERKRQQDDQAFLAEVSTILASSLQLEETLSRIARVALGWRADCVIVEIAEEDDEQSRVRAVHADPTKRALCERIERLGLTGARLLSKSAPPRSREPRLASKLTEAELLAVAEADEQRRVIRELSPKSLLSVPLRGRAGVLGALTFISTVPARYGKSDLELAADLGYRAGLAIENARLYERARQATRARDEVLGIVAHDLRNPLATILIQTALLDRRRSDPDRAILALRRAAQRMNRLIQDLLDITQIEAEKLYFERNTLDVERLLTDCVEGQQALASSASLTLTLDYEPGLPPLWADRDRLWQVFENLIGNAVKFTPKGGTVTLGAKPLENNVLFWVADTGAGIPAEQIPHLFDRFWQAQKSQRQGAGLGLAIVKGIVEAHGGKLWVESDLGSGSTFFFTLPTTPEPERPDLE